MPRARGHPPRGAPPAPPSAPPAPPSAATERWAGRGAIVSNLVKTVARHQLPAVPDESLWEVLNLYGVHPHVINLLEDLHTSTEAVVRVDGEVGRSFTVKAGVRQGCVLAPTFSNVFVDHILQEALSQLPTDKQFGEQLLQSRAVHCRQQRQTEIMVVGQPITLPTFKLSGKELLVTDSFKYLESFFADDGSMRTEMDVRNVRALAAFCQFQDIWASP
eukprot:349707-Chlamydomonas_euryale.AAC.2